MKVGGTTISIVSDGTYLIDGGSLFGQVPRSFWEQQIKPDRKNRVKVGLNCLLIQTPTKNILVASGMGSKLLAKHRDTHGLNGNKLLKGLKKEGLTARDIDILIFTQLHFDHCGGCTKLDRAGTPVPTFTKAKVMVQRACWEEANDPLERSRSLFDKEDFAPLEESGALSLLDGDSEIGIPAGTQSGDEIRLKGKGVPHLHGRNRRGDQVVTLVVKTPTSLTDTQRDLMESLARIFDRESPDKDNKSKKWFGKKK